MADKKYKYRYFSLILDPIDPEDKEILDWLKATKTRKLKYTTLIKLALKQFIKNSKKGK